MSHATCRRGAVGYRLDHAGRSFVFSGDTRPCRHLVEACDGADLLVHETFPTASALSQKAGMPLAVAEMIVNGAHTSPAMAGMVFERAGVRMAEMWHVVVDHDKLGPVFSEMRTRHDGPVVSSQDLTVFNITAEAVVARLATIDPFRWPVTGESNEQGPPANPPLEPPAWWADALITD